MDELPTDYDVIVIGTGMAESTVAAAASRIGKRVLHMDCSDYYGGLWASFNLDSIQKLVQEADKNKDKCLDGIFNVEHSWHIAKSVPEQDLPKEDPPSAESAESDNAEKPKKNESGPWTQDTLLKEYRKFNIDLAPKLLYARGELVELLISSNIARYAEFRCVNRVLTWIGDSLQPVPCSRADVFATKHVTVVEKRMLMKLLTAFMEFDRNNPSEEFQGFENKSFSDYLKSKELTGNLIHYALYAIAGVSDRAPCFDGVESCRRFLVSLGRYGNTPFLWSMYGCGELPQCFCRLCAVFGGVYCLNRPIDAIKFDENAEDKGKTVIVESSGKNLNCEHLVVGIDKTPDYLLANKNFTRGLSRGVFVINKSMMNEYDREPLTLLRFPPLDDKGEPVTVIELGPSTSSCPKGLFLVHMTCSQNTNAKEDLHKYAEKLFSFEQKESVMSPEKGSGDDVSKPQVLWSMYFNMVDTSDNQKIESASKNIHITTGPDVDLDFDHAVKQAREIFLSIYPGEEFLPRAPDPEEIVFEGEDAETGPEFQKDEGAAEGEGKKESEE